ncbi:MAG: hypothetical protein ACON4H_02115 [Rubripirellula sp.]
MTTAPPIPAQCEWESDGSGSRNEPESQMLRAGVVSKAWLAGWHAESSVILLAC